MVISKVEELGEILHFIIDKDWKFTYKKFWKVNA